MVDVKTANMIAGAPLSNNTVRSRIHELSGDVENRLIHDYAKENFQTDETTDVAGLAMLMAFVFFMKMFCSASLFRLLQAAGKYFLSLTP